MKATPTRIETRFAELAAANRAALVPFVTAGDPVFPDTVELMHALVAAGADVIELGVPFSDPMADGPVIQRASERALATGVGTRRVFEMVRKFRAQDTTTPVVLMGYLNPIEAFGYEAFAEQASGAGVDGTIVVDLPPEEAAELSAIFDDAEVATVFLLSPTTTAERIDMVAKRGRGFVYYISVTGVTGGKAIQAEVTGDAVARARATVRLPICVGFGIRDAEAARRVADFADGVVVGSALIAAMEDAAGAGGDPVAAAGDLVRSLRGAMDDARKAA